MEQYDKKGPPPVSSEEPSDYRPLIRGLSEKIEILSRHIDTQDREIRRLKNDLKSIINSINRLR